MKVTYSPNVRKYTYITVRCPGDIVRTIEWDAWTLSKKDMAEIVKSVNNGTYTEWQIIGCERLTRLVNENIIHAMFGRIAHELGRICCTDESLSQKVFEKAAIIATEADSALGGHRHEDWLKSAMASIRKYQRYGSDYSVARDYAELIKYFYLFEVLAIDPYVRPQNAKKATILMKS